MVNAGQDVVFLPCPIYNQNNLQKHRGAHGAEKVWMSPGTGNYMLRVLGGNLGIVLLAVLLIVGGTVLSFIWICRGGRFR